MNSLRVFNRQAGFVIAIAALLLALVLPTLASAAQVTERSVALSSSATTATGVTYKVKFTAVQAAGAFVIDFCSNSPIVLESCTAPTGFDASAAATATANYSIADKTTSKVVVASTITASQQVEVDVSGITNPSATGQLYARIITYDTSANAIANYTTTALGGGAADTGSVAIAITNKIAVSAAVLESMLFCVSGTTIPADCASTTSTALKIGETTGTAKALSAGAVSTGDIYTQLSTNAASGAVVNLKSSATDCGGLLRAGDVTGACDIKPALQTGITLGQAKFGVLANAEADTGTSPTGLLQAVTGSGYNGTTYALNYVAGNGSGVTSVFGDPFLDTNTAPANNKNMKLTFGASVTNSTPAGLYSADLSLIATGKF